MKNRRKFLQLMAGGAVVLPLVTLAGCNANTILTDLQTIVNDADAVVTAAANSAGTIAQPVFVLLETWLTQVKSAVDQALVIDMGAATLTAAQVASIIELFANLAIANIPGLGPEVSGLVAVAEVAINTLLALLHHATPAGIVATAKKETGKYRGVGSEYYHVKSMNGKFGKNITNLHLVHAAVMRGDAHA